MTNLSPLQQLLDNDIEARELGWIMDDILCEYGYYLATNEDMPQLQSKAKDHLYFLRKVRDCLYAIGGVRELQ